MHLISITIHIALALLLPIGFTLLLMLIHKICAHRYTYEIADAGKVEIRMFWLLFILFSFLFTVAKYCSPKSSNYESCQLP